MADYALSRRARSQLFEIWGYIAADSEQNADNLLLEFLDHFRMLAQNPRAGRKRDNTRPGIRSFPVGEYLIFYRIGAPGVRIIDVVHGRRNLRRLPI